MFFVASFGLDGGFSDLMGLPEPSNGIIFVKCWNFSRDL
jgi:hypothetical protein